MSIFDEDSDLGTETAEKVAFNTALAAQMESPSDDKFSLFIALVAKAKSYPYYYSAGPHYYDLFTAAL